MSGPSLTNPSYSTLATYAVLSSSGITTTGGATTITGGNIGSSATPTYTGTFVLTSPASIDSANANTAETQLTAFVNDIDAYVVGITPNALPTTDITTPVIFTPNTNNNSASSITFSGSSITFDAQGDSTAQFYVIAGTGAITFNNITSINLIGGASSDNIFWLAGSAISFTGTDPANIYGTFIAQSSITFANSSVTNGRLYAQTAAVVFNGTSSINTAAVIGGSGSSSGSGSGSGSGSSSGSGSGSSSGSGSGSSSGSGSGSSSGSGSGSGSGSSSSIPISTICFPGNTPIQTDQGNIQIQHINVNFHTIHKKPIIAITKSVTPDEFLICFEKDSISPNYPNKTTIMTKDHKVSHRGKMREAHKYLGKYEGVHKIKYAGEILYNVLMENYTDMRVNGLICETLHPENIVAKISASRYSENTKQNLVVMLNDCILNNNQEKYKSMIKHLSPPTGFW